MERLFLLAILAAASAVAQVQHQHHAKHMDAESYARVLEDPSRDAWQKPHAVLQTLALKPTEVVADIGAGTGYFARRFAHHVATVYAVDIDPKLLEIASQKAPANLKTVLASPDDPKLAKASVDTIFICNVLHHIDNRPAYLETLRSALKPGGRIVVLEFHKKELPVGPPAEMKIAEPALIQEFRGAGFEVARRHDILPYQYFLEFRSR